MHRISRFSPIQTWPKSHNTCWVEISASFNPEAHFSCLAVLVCCCFSLLFSVLRCFSLAMLCGSANNFAVPLWLFFALFAIFIRAFQWNSNHSQFHQARESDAKKQILARRQHGNDDTGTLFVLLCCFVPCSGIVCLPELFAEHQFIPCTCRCARATSST